MKTCKICKIEKDLKDFQKSAKLKDGLDWNCKACRNRRVLQYTMARIESSFVTENERRCAECREILAAELFWKNNIKCPKCIKKKCGTEQYRESRARAHKRLSQDRNYKDIRNDRKRKWRANRSPEQRQKDYLYGLHHSRRYSERRNQRIKERRAVDISFKITKILRTSFAMMVRKGYKQGSSLDLLGCSLPYFKKWIALQFQENMFWWNWGHGKGKWNLDHIIPISLFNLMDITEQKKCFHYTNFRPLWHTDNARKSDRISNGSKARYIRDRAYEDRLDLAADISKIRF